MNPSEVVLGAVAYDPKVVTIWDGFRTWFRAQGLRFDVVLYSNYESQVEALLARQITVAWNSPLAWVRARRAAAADGRSAQAIAMRDTDQELTSLILVRSDAPQRSLADLRGLTVATGAIDSPQATLLPLGLLHRSGLVPGRDVAVRRFDLHVGMHGDHIGGEREAVRALMRGEADAACIIDANHLLFTHEGILSGSSVRILARTEPYDHCNVTALDSPPVLDGPLAEFQRLLLGMSYADAAVRPLLDLEGLTAWRAGRVTHYRALEEAVDALAFYD
nr:PhnD/SsuA/transferrin family substrate-binding protein [Planctomycetota bacterium]